MALQELDALRQQIAESRTVEGGVVALVRGIKEKIQAVIDALRGDTVSKSQLISELAELTSELDLQEVSIAGAVLEGTEALKVEPPVEEGGPDVA